jgi:hypothetical protein
MDRPAADSPLGVPPLCHGGGLRKQRRYVARVVRVLVRQDFGWISNVRVNFEIYVTALEGLN